VSRASYANYDAHVVPVRPKNPYNQREDTYHPCRIDESPTYTEVVVFDKAQCLPRYLIGLQPTRVTEIGTPPIAKVALLFSHSVKGSLLVHETSVPGTGPLPALEQAAKVAPSELTSFLTCIVQGKQDEAESMLQKLPDLALYAGDVTDHADRTFK